MPDLTEEKDIKDMSVDEKIDYILRRVKNTDDKVETMVGGFELGQKIAVGIFTVLGAFSMVGGGVIWILNHVKLH